MVAINALISCKSNNNILFLVENIKERFFKHQLTIFYLVQISFSSSYNVFIILLRGTEGRRFELNRIIYIVIACLKESAFHFSILRREDYCSITNYNQVTSFIDDVFRVKDKVLECNYLKTILGNIYFIITPFNAYIINFTIILKPFYSYILFFFNAVK